MLNKYHAYENGHCATCGKSEADCLAGVNMPTITDISDDDTLTITAGSAGDRCTVCGLPLAIGEWPCVTTIKPHGTSVQTNAFAEYFDTGLGMQVTSLGQRKQAMRANKLDYRDLPRRGDLSARRDRIEQQKREKVTSG